MDRREGSVLRVAKFDSIDSMREKGKGRGEEESSGFVEEQREADNLICCGVFAKRCRGIRGR